MSKLIEQIGKAAVQVAHREWKSVVVDPDNGDRIQDYYEKSGAGWAVEDGYQEAIDFWCGVFAGYCFEHAREFINGSACIDLSLQTVVGQEFFPSTTRLAGRGPHSWEDVQLPAPQVVDPAGIQAGDIVVVSTGRTSREWGDHITLAQCTPDGEKIQTIEGNARGTLGDSTFGEGIVVNERSFAEIAVVYRLKKAHFVGSYIEK